MWSFPFVSTSLWNIPNALENEEDKDAAPKQGSWKAVRNQSSFSQSEAADVSMTVNGMQAMVYQS